MLIPIFLVCLSLIKLTTGLEAITRLPFPGANGIQCLAGQFLDTTVQSCVACKSVDEVAIPDIFKADTRGNPLQCKCPIGYLQETTDCSTTTTGLCKGFSCTACFTTTNATSLTSLDDNSLCLTCGSTTSGMELSDEESVFYGSCKCPLSSAGGFKALSGLDVAGRVNVPRQMQCNTCPDNAGVFHESAVIAGRSYLKDIHTCQACPDPNHEMTFDTSGKPSGCACKTDFTLAGVGAVGETYCVPTATGASFVSAAPSSSVLPFFLDDATEPTPVSSLIVQHYFPRAAEGCRHFGLGLSDDAQDCQLLANLCTLAHFDPTSAPCIEYDAIMELRGVNVNFDVETWGKGMAWLKYITPVGQAVCKDTSIKDTMTLNEKHMKFVIAKYTFNGTFLGYHNLSTDLTYCRTTAPNSHRGGGEASRTSWQIFGASEVIKSTCDLELLLDEEMLFYEMYYLDSDNSMYPVPVRTTEFCPDGVCTVEYPIDQCTITDTLFRRFFLFDTLGGIDEVSVDEEKPTIRNPTHVRYAKTISLEIRSQNANAAKLYAPILTINYNGLTRAAYKGSNQQEQPAVLAVRYTQSVGRFYLILEPFFIAAATMFGLVALMRAYNYLSRHNRPVVDAQQVFQGYGPGMNLRTAREAVAILTHSWCILFIPMTILISWYFFVFFKLQTTPALMLPPQTVVAGQSSPYWIFASTVHVLGFFMFYVVLHHIWKQSNADIFFVDWEQVRKGHNTVSVWRTILCVNEWNEMMAMRRTNIPFTLCWLAFFLIFLKLENNCTQQPDITNLEDGECNIVLRFANTTWFWISISFVQWLWRFTIYERYISEPPEQRFIDLCTIAKVSVVILSEPYYGYYLHCRSPHQYADGNMAELVEMLHKEEAGLTVDRSLDGAPPDVQSFELFVTAEWRNFFDRIYQHFRQPVSVFDGFNKTLDFILGNRRRGQGPAAGGLTANATIEGNMKAMHELNLFMRDFVDDNWQRVGLRRQIIESSYSDKLFKVPPTLSMGEMSCVMRPDRSWDFTKTMFLGIELDLLIFDIFAFALFDIWFDNTALSILLLYLTDSGLWMLRRSLGSQSLSKKTMLDERFLI